MWPCDNLDESSDIFSEWKKSVPKCYILWGSTHIEFLQWKITEMDKLVGSGVKDGSKMGIKWEVGYKRVT